MSYIEGFLCPECMREFPSGIDLQQHWEDTHHHHDIQEEASSSGATNGETSVVQSQLKNHNFVPAASPMFKTCGVCISEDSFQGVTCTTCGYTCHSSCLPQIPVCDKGDKKSQKGEEKRQSKHDQKMFNALTQLMSGGNNNSSKNNNDDKQGPPKSSYKSFTKNILKYTVSRGRSRHVDHEFDLDLTYITDRIIAMSFPATGLETTYRNAINDVAKLLKKKHQDNYLVFNLSERSYDISKLNNQVLDFGWPDHLAPPLERLCSICKSIDSWLKSDPQHVVVVHCKGGKGRTGVVVASYMHYSNQAESPEAALDEFAMRRFYDDKLAGVTQPSQRRYVHYLDDWVADKITMSDRSIFLKHIVVNCIPNFDGKGGCRPFISIYQGFELIYETNIYSFTADRNKFRVTIENGLEVHQDVLIKCSHKNITSGREVIFRCQFHTDAIQNNFLRLEKSQLDVAWRDKRFPEDGAVEFMFSSSVDNSSEPNTDNDVFHEYYFPRKRITSYQSTDSLDKWQKSKDHEENTREEIELVQMMRDKS